MEPRTSPAPHAANAPPIWWNVNTQPKTMLDFSGPNAAATSATVGGTVAIQSRP